MGNKSYTKGDVKLRTKAEAVLKVTNAPTVSAGTTDFNQLIHELQIHKVELEMQNQELWRTQGELLQSHEKFADLYNLAPVAYFTLDKYGIIKACNLSSTRLLHINKNELEGNRFQSFICPDHLDTFHEFLKNVTSSEVKHSCTVTFSLKNVSFFYGLLEGVSVSFSGSESLCYVALINITDKKEIELKLKESKESLEMALLAAKAGTWTIELKTNTFSWDNYNHSIYGLKAGSFNGEYRHFLTFIHRDDREGVDTALRTAITNHQDLNVEYRVLWPDGQTRFVKSMGRLLASGEEPQRFVGITMDITEQKKLEEKAVLMRLEEQKKILNTIIQTQESERTRISEYLHNGLAQLLYAAKLNIPGVVSKHPECERVLDLLDDAIEQIRAISFELSPTILRDFGLTSAVQEMVSRISNKKLNIHTDIQEFHARFPEMLETSVYRIIQELLNNVIKHAEATEALVKLKQINTTLSIEVNDNGVGFDSTGQASAKGIGLSSVKNRVEMLNGKLEIHAFPGQGTRITIALELKKFTNGQGEKRN